MLVICAMLLSGCLQTLRGMLPTDHETENVDTVPGNKPNGQTGEKKQQPTFAQFSDVPIPAGAILDFDKLLVLGTEEGWIGRLPLQVKFTMTHMYSFYEREMPRFSWERVTVVRSSVSVMTYRRNGRITTITLQDNLTGGSTVNFTVAPEATGGPVTPRSSQIPVK